MQFRTLIPPAPAVLFVCVAGEFNGWSTAANSLFQEDGGYWSVDVPGAAEGQQYRFVLTNASVPGSLWRMDPYVRQIVRSGGVLNGVIGPSNEDIAAVPGYSTPSWNVMVIYEVNVRAFLSDANSLWTDMNGSWTGTFAILSSKLDYLQWLGVNAPEIMPLGEFTTPVSAGYNYAYMFAVEDEFGGPDGFRAFVGQAHQRGVAIIVDVVYNHVGADAGDMWQFDDWTAAPQYGGIYFYNDWRRTTGWGDRLDYGRGEVRQYIRDNALRWLEQRSADGLRWDSVGSIRNMYDRNNDPADDLPDGWSLCQWINSLIVQRQPWKISIAEDLKDNEWITKSDGAGGAGFDAQWGINFFWKFHGVMTALDDGSRDMDAVAWAVGQTYNQDAFERVIYTESHDGVDGTANPPMARVPEMIWPGKADSWASKKRSTLGAAALMTSPGIPMMLWDRSFSLTARGSPTSSWTGLAPGCSMGSPTSIETSSIFGATGFNNTRGLQGQSTNVFKGDNASKIIAYHRWSQGGPGDDVVVVLNFGNLGYDNLRVGFLRAGLWRVRFNSDWTGYDAYFANWFSYDTATDGGGWDNMPFAANVGIGPYSAIIFSQD